MATFTSQPITRQGLEGLQAELKALVEIRRPELSARLRDVREDGSEPSENPALTAAMDDCAALERRIGELEATVAQVEVVDPPADGTIGIGSLVRLGMAGRARPLEYRLVGPVECDPSRGRISVDSPVGSALIGRCAGDVVEVDTPGGPRSMQIVAVESS